MGTTVTISGANLGTASTATVKFGAATAAIISNTGTQIVATSPAGTAGTVDVTVTTVGGDSAISSADRFTYYVPPPTVSGINPSTFWSEDHTLPAGTPLLGVYFSEPVLGGGGRQLRLGCGGAGRATGHERRCRCATDGHLCGQFCHAPFPAAHGGHLPPRGS